MNETKHTTAVSYLALVLTAMVMAVNYELFIFPNAFAPAGINGLATMVQKLFHFSVGYMSLIINVPLCLIAFLKGERRFALRTFVFVLVFSGALLVCNAGWIDLSSFAYHTDNGTSTILAPVAAGVLNGLIIGIVFRSSGSTGGTDILGVLIHRVRPELNTLWIVFSLNTLVACLSFFVYDFNFEPVIMCIIYCFFTSRISDLILQGFKNQLKFEIITDQAEDLSRDIIRELRHSATLVQARGMYTGDEHQLLICVIQKHQIAKLQAILRNYPGSFAYLSPVNEVLGNFKNIPRNAPKNK